MTFPRFAAALLLFVLVLAGQPLRAQSTRSLTTTLEEVTVFLNRAQLMHEATGTAESGLTQFVLKGLPSNLDPQSLTVEARGNVLLQGVQFQNNFLKPGAKPVNIVKLEDSLEYYRDQIRIRNDQRDILTKEEGMVLANQSIGGDKGVEAEHLEEMADFFRQRLTKIRSLILQEDKLLVKLRRREEAVYRQLNELNNRPSQPTGEVAVLISASSRTPVQFVVTYIAKNAGWQPLYDLRVADTKGPVKLIYKANVYQQTGLDWNKVKLKLSSGNPAIGGVKPELRPWYLQVVDMEAVAVSSGRRRAKAAAYNADMAVLKEESLAPAQTMADNTTVTENMLAVEFNINLPYTIPSDGKPHPIELQQHDLKASYQHIAVPKLDLTAFLVAQITGWDQYNLLPGNVNTYFAGTFVGTSFIDANTTSDTLSISMGRDKNVVISREKVKDFRGKGLFGSNIKETSGYRISVRNSKPEPVTIVLEDQVPVSGNSDINVDVQELSGGKLDKATGKVTWELKLAPNETKKVDLKYEVKYPKGRHISGL